LATQAISVPVYPQGPFESTPGDSSRERQPAGFSFLKAEHRGLRTAIVW